MSHIADQKTILQSHPAILYKDLYRWWAYLTLTCIVTSSSMVWVSLKNVVQSIHWLLVCTWNKIKMKQIIRAYNIYPRIILFPITTHFPLCSDKTVYFSDHSFLFWYIPLSAWYDVFASNFWNVALNLQALCCLIEFHIWFSTHPF